MNKQLDLTKPVQTRKGLPVRILCTDRKGDQYPVIGLIYDGGMEHVESWMSDGSSGITIGDDLVNVPTKKGGWVNIYPSVCPNSWCAQTSVVYTSKKKADELAGPTRIACIRIEWEE